MFVMDEELILDTSVNNIKWDSLSKSFQLPVGLVLPYDQNSLSFSFGSTDVLNRDKLNYRFILEGEDEDWTFVGKSIKTKNYYNLAPGSYTFKVSSRSVNKEWSTPDTLSFRISPPWWQTWWAYLIYGLLTISGIWLIVQFRSNQLKRKNRLLEEEVASRTMKLRESIDSLKTTQAQLIQSEKMASLGELTAGIAHEIQNPLNFVNNFSEVNAELIDELIEEIKKGNFDEVKELASDIKSNEEKIKHHGNRADSIVKGMLKHSRSSSGERTATDINEMCDEYLRLSYHGLRAKDNTFNAKLETDFDESIGSINIIAQDISRVVLNLITNAFQACGDNGVVKVSTRKLKDRIEIRVKDNGSGIPDEIKDKIFQPFFTTKPTGQGTGLGLSLSYDIVKAHGGELSVESQQGEGTEFTVRIPIA
jgi:signal transduction histidine kinase